MHVERTFTVGTPIEKVFTYLADFTHTKEWDPGTVDTRRTGGNGGLHTTYLNISRFMGREVELTYETVEHDPPVRLQFQGRNGRATATDSLDLNPTDDDGTRVHYRADFEFGPLVGLVAPLVVKPKLEGLADETVAQLRDTLEKLV